VFDEGSTEGGLSKKVEALFEDWIKRRLVRPFGGRRAFNSRDLPPECQQELFRMFGRRIKKVILDANRQIKETKRHFGLEDAKGLLLLVNDGNYSLEFNVLLYLVDRALGRQCSSINSVICFTVNMRSRMAAVHRDVLVWVPARRNGLPNVSNDFLDWFRDGWMKFLGELVGERVSTLAVSQSQVIKTSSSFIHQNQENITKLETPPL
jgi:hypothetical protein